MTTEGFERGRHHACVAGMLLWLVAGTAAAQSAADLSGRLRIDGDTRDFTAAEAVFRNPEVCASLPPGTCADPSVDEEPADDSVWSQLQDVRQIHVTWDAAALYLGVDARIDGQTLLVLIDVVPGGPEAFARPSAWRRALQFGTALRPEAFVAVQDGARSPELWVREAREAWRRVPAAAWQGLATFAGSAPARALEAAIPWRILFPAAPQAPNPEPGAPGAPMFVLPPEASQHGLRLVAAVVDSRAGWGAGDLAPDATMPLAFDARRPAVVDRAVRVEWDADSTRAPSFVDFGVAIQQQANRFVPAASGAAPAGTPPRLEELDTFLLDPGGGAGAASRLVLAGTSYALGFRFDVPAPAPAELFVSASLFSLRGERIRDLYREDPRVARTLPGPYGPFGDPALDRWDGRDSAGKVVPAGMYVLRLTVGTRPGIVTHRLQRTVAVVR